MFTSIGAVTLAGVASTFVARLVWTVPQTDDPCQLIYVPSAFVGIGGMDRDRDRDRDKAHATLAYVQEILHRAVKLGNCTPCSADRYS